MQLQNDLIENGFEKVKTQLSNRFPFHRFKCTLIDDNTIDIHILNNPTETGVHDTKKLYNDIEWVVTNFSTIKQTNIKQK